MARRFLMIKEEQSVKLHYNCPVCGSNNVTAAVKKPMGLFIKDGPTVIMFRCRRCGHSWTIPFRVGP